MVVTKLLFNNIKEFTPKCVKTLPYSMSVPPTFSNRPNKAWLLWRTPGFQRLI